MAASEVAIANRALDLLGQHPIISFADGTNVAGLCQRNYPLARDAVLRSYPWNCAIRRAALPALTTAPAWGYLYAYALPAGPSPEFCLRVLDVDGALDDGARWVIEGRQIHTDITAPLNIRYVARLADVGLFDPLLDEAIATKLALDLAEAVTGSGTQKQIAAQAFADALRAARRADAREGFAAERIIADDWLAARL